MIVHMTNGMVYTIPHGVRRANLQIAMSEAHIKAAAFNLRQVEREVAFERNREVLMGFRYIGCEVTQRDDVQIDTHWFIDHRDLNTCSVKLEGEA